VAPVSLIFLRINWLSRLHWPKKWLDGFQPRK